MDLVSETIIHALDQRGAHYQKTPFGGALVTVAAVASELGVTSDQIVKAMATKARDGSIIIVALPGSRRLDLRTVIDVVGQKLELLRPDRIPALLGVPVGAVSPL